MFSIGSRGKISPPPQASPARGERNHAQRQRRNCIFLGLPHGGGDVKSAQGWVLSPLWDPLGNCVSVPAGHGQRPYRSLTYSHFLLNLKWDLEITDGEEP
jgi:hypothetical protein